MREILFKAKRLDNGEWVEGFYVKRKAYCFDNRTYDVKTVIMTEFSSGGFVCFEVDENTICQYTGLTDKNGNKIWENDILKSDKGLIRAVKWEMSCGSCCTQVVGFGASGQGHTDFIYLDDLEEVEVIGNIFDNPEQIGGGE